MNAALDSRPRAIISPFRSITFSEITLDMQRHIVVIDDRESSRKHRYVIDTHFRPREGYCFTVVWKPLWETTEQTICSGSRYETADLAVSSALSRIEAWERWLEASTSDNE